MHDFKLILHKELIDIFRDKRSFIMLFVPVLLFPVMFTLMGSQLDNTKTKRDIPCIVNWADEDGEALYHALFDNTVDEEGNRITYIDRVRSDKSDPEALKTGEVYVVLTFRDDAITLLYNDASTNSATAMGTLSTYLSAQYQAMLDGTIRQQFGVNMESIRPFEQIPQALSAVTGDAGNSVMASIAPMLLVVMIMSGGVSVAVDLFTGEKERGTFESLMTTQAGRMSILMAKFSATLLVSLLGMTLSILAYVISLSTSKSAWVMLSGSAKAEGAKLNMTSGQVFSLLLVCVALSVFAVSLMTLIGLHAKTVKEAQSQMSLLTVFPTLLSGLTMFMESASIRPASMLIPVYNAILSIKMIFLGTVQTGHILLTVLSCTAFSACMWFLSVRMLRSEKLLRG